MGAAPNVAGWTGHLCPSYPAGDEPLYGPFFAAETAEDLRRRFFAPVKDFSHKFIAPFTDIDYGKAMAFIALDAATGEMLGVARLHDNPGKDFGETPSSFAPISRPTA